MGRESERERDSRRSSNEPVLRISSPVGKKRYEDLSAVALSVGVSAGIVLLALGVPKGDLPLFGTIVLVCVVGLVGGTILARRGTLDDAVVFEADRINFFGPTHAVVSWVEIEGYRDGSADWVELVSARGRGHRLLVPTFHETDRVAVLELLDRRGLHRLE